MLKKYFDKCLPLTSMSNALTIQCLVPNNKLAIYVIYLSNAASIFRKTSL